MTDTECDVVVIGTGPAGAAAAWRLAVGGLKVVCLERGGWLDYELLRRDEPDWPLRRSREWNTNPNLRRHPADYPIDDAESDIKPMLFNAVGGSSLMWSGHVPRFRRVDFELHRRHGVGRDWPIGYDDLEPYYEINERVIGIAAEPGDLKAPGRQRPVAPPLNIGKVGWQMRAAFNRLGWHSWPVDLTIGPAAAMVSEPCLHPGPCDFGCSSRRRASADFNYVPAAIEAGARLITWARATHLEHDAADRVTAVVYRDRDGHEQRLRAERFVIAGNGIASPWLLLHSASGRFPNGLANGSGQLGRNLMLHPTARAYGRFPPSMNLWAEGKRSSILSYEFYGPQPDHDFPSGFVLQLTGGVSPLETALGSVTGTALPWGRAHHAAFERAFDHVAGFGISVDDMPREENRVTLSEVVKDCDGHAAAKMIYRIDPPTRRMLAFAMDRATEVLREAGAGEIYPIPFRGEAGFHLMGTARMGRSPDDSVVDQFCRAHEIDNLYVVDSSVFVTGAAVNPTHTAQAIALRAADRILGRVLPN